MFVSSRIAQYMIYKLTRKALPDQFAPLGLSLSFLGRCWDTPFYSIYYNLSWPLFRVGRSVKWVLQESPEDVQKLSQQNATTLRLLFTKIKVVATLQFRSKFQFRSALYPRNYTDCIRSISSSSLYLNPQEISLLLKKALKKSWWDSFILYFGVKLKLFDFHWQMEFLHTSKRFLCAAISPTNSSYHDASQGVPDIVNQVNNNSDNQ